MAKLKIKKADEIQKEKEINEKKSQLKKLEKEYEGLNNAALKTFVRKDEMPKGLKEQVESKLSEIKEVEDELETLS